MNFDQIFILTYGRSGSTLLQGVLNSIPGVLIRGENKGALRGLIQSWTDLSIAQEKHGDRSADVVSPWFGVGDVDIDEYGRGLTEFFVQTVLRPAPDTEVIGFKEIRYYPPTCELEGELSFMRRYFSRPAFIVNTREIEHAVASSIKHNFRVDPEQIRNSDKALRSLEGDDVFHVHYDDYNGRPEVLKDLYEFLGADFNVSKIAAVMDVEHSVMKANQSAVSA